MLSALANEHALGGVDVDVVAVATPSLSSRTFRLAEFLADGDKPNGMGSWDGAGDCSLVPTGTTGVVMLVNELFFNMPSKTLLLELLLLLLPRPLVELLLLLKLARFLLDRWLFESGVWVLLGGLNREARSLWGVWLLALLFACSWG